MKRVVVGMSGGVDSSVAAYLLKEEGYDVIGVHLHLIDNDGHADSFSSCLKQTSANDAKTVCQKLQIPFLEVDYAKQFKEQVMQYFIQSYVSGSTPNPCVMCNRLVKWDGLMHAAKMKDASYIATGHYANIRTLKNGRHTIEVPKDKRKDQTYFLYNLTQEHLSHTLFPLYAYEKSHIREIANHIGLHVSQKKDSQDVCFIPDNDYITFLKESNVSLPPKGEFVDIHGNVLGEHNGICAYTIGQRKGLGISLGERTFVISIDANSNRITLGTDAMTYRDYLYATKINYMSNERFDENEQYIAKVRYAHDGTPCKISYRSEDLIRVDFTEPVRAVTPGQAIVIYQHGVVAGGGMIIGYNESSEGLRFSNKT